MSEPHPYCTEHDQPLDWCSHGEAGKEPLVLPPEEMAAVRQVAAALDKIAARHLDEAASIVSGLILDEIGLDGHGEANRLWRIAAYLRERAKRNEP